MSISFSVKNIGLSRKAAGQAAGRTLELGGRAVMPRLSGARTCLLVLGLVLFGAASARAAVTITAATGGSSVSADTAQNAAAPSFTTLGNIVILEGANGDFATGTGVTLILTAPTGWRFNAGTGSATAAKISGPGAPEVAVNSTTVTASNITVNFTVSGMGQINSLTISGIQVQPTNGAALPSIGNIFRAIGNPGTAFIIGIAMTPNASGSGGSNFGSLTQVAGAVVKLGYTTQPGSATAGAVFGVQPVVRTQDQFGNNSTTGLGATVNVAISLTSGTGPLQGTTTFNIGTAGGNGTVSYTNLRIDAAGTNKQLTAAAAGLTSALSSTFTVSTAAASQLAFSQQPTNTTAGQSISPAVTVQVKDAFGNNVSAGSVSVDMSLTSGTGVLNGTTTRTTDSGGLATFDNLSINLTGVKKLTATNSILGSVESGTFAILAAAPSQVIFVQQPGAATAGTPITPAVQVHVADSFGNDVPGATVSMSLNGTGVLSGTTAQSTDGAGVATFANLSVNLVGSKTLTATCGAAAPVTSNPFVISPAGASQLAFVQQPGNATAGTVIAPPMTVQVQDALGNNVPDGGVAITMALTTGTGALSGTTSRTTDPTGLATFGDLTINLSGSKNLTASSAGLNSAVSSAFTISAAAATQLAFTQQPSDAVAGVAISPAVQIRVNDNFGNGVPGAFVAIALSSGDGTLSGTAGKPSDSSGFAAFDDLSIDLSGSKKLLALSGFLLPVESNPFDISPGAPSKLVIETQPSATATAGEVFAQQPVLRVEDQFGNLVTPDNATVVTAARAAGSGTLQGTVTATAVAGMVTFTNLSHNVASAITVRFTSGSLTDATSDPITVTAGIGRRLAIQTQPSATATAGLAFAQQPVIRVEDQFGNLVSSDNTTLVTASRNAGAGTLQGPTTAAAVSGVVTFSGLFHTVASTITIDFTSGTLTNATSGNVVVSAASAFRLAIQTQPSATATVTAPFAQQPVIRIEDQFGNQITSDNSTVVTAARAAGTGNLLGTLNVIAASGLASFGNLAHDTVDTITIGFSAPSLIGITSSNVVVSKGNTTTTISSSANPSVAGQPVTFTATVGSVTAGTTNRTGTVQFRIDGVDFGTPVTLSGNSATSGAISSLSAAGHTVAAVYSGDANFNGSTSSNLTQTVNKANTTTTVASSANPSVFGQAVVFTATVTATLPSTGTPTGTVTFRDGAVTLATVTLSSGQATYTNSSLSVANHTISVVYNGDAAFNTSTSPNLTQTVNRANTATAVASSANPTCVGQSVMFTATVSVVAPGSGTPTGTLQFRTNGSNFGPAVTLTNGIATSGTIATLPVGNHTITAVYTATAGSNYNSSTSPNFTQTVAALPTCSITGSTSVCANVTGNLYTAPAGMMIYAWSISGNGIVNGATNGQTISVDPTGAGSFTLALSITTTNGCSSSCNRTVAVNVPPAITSQPSSRTNCAGSVATFSVTATGSSLTYQWRRNGVNLVNGGSVSGATTATLTLNPAAVGDSGSYDVVVSGVCAPSVTSGVATLTVNPTPDATITGASEACENSSSNIAAVPDGGPGVTYFWTVTGGTITSGQGTRSITFLPTTAGSLTVAATLTNSFGCTATSSRSVPISKSHADIQVWQTRPTTLWNEGGTLNSGDHSYNEGNPVPFRLVLVCAPATWSFTFQYDFVDNNTPTHFIDFLTTFNTPDCRSAPVSTRECDNQTCVGAPTLFPIPADPSLPPGIQNPGNFTVYNGTITNVGVYTTNLSAGTVSKRVTISGTSAGTAPNVLILFGGHLAAEQDWGIGNGASSYPGSSAKMAVISFSGGGNDDTASINPLGVQRTFLTLGDVTVVEGNSGTTLATLSLTLSAPGAFPVSVDWVTADGTATLADNDYQGTNGTVNFAPGETNKTITVLVNGDTKFEPNESFAVILTDRCSAGVAKGTGLITIQNDDGVPILGINDVAVTEGNSGTTNAVFTVSLSNPSSQTIAVNYATANGTATLADNDYQSASGTLTLAPGQTNGTITVLVNGDTKFELAETFLVDLSGATNATIADNQGIGTINNDDLVPAISINDVTVTEGNSGTVNAVFTLSLSVPSSQIVTVMYGTADGTATLADNDYQAGSGIVTFAAGQTNQTLIVLVNGDTRFEPNETFHVNLSSATNSTIADNQGIGTIINDDLLPSITLNDVTVTEGNSGTVHAVFTVSLSNPSSQIITVNYSTADGTATLADNDYQNATGTVTFAPGQTNQTLTVLVNGDTKLEPNEAFHVNLSGASNGTIADNQAIGTIVNDDSQPTIAINDVTVMELDSLTTNAVFTISLSNPSYQPITVNYTTADGTATTADYQSESGTVTFAPGEITLSIAIVVKADTIDEPTETFFVDLTDPVNATLADNQGIGTILDNDSPPSLSINSVTVTEGNSGTTLAISTVTLSAPSDFAVTVDWATTDGTATVADNDYAAAGGTLSFAPGITTRTITNAVNGDLLDEANEGFFVNLAGATNATISDPQGVVTILNDDGGPTIGINDVSITEGNSGTTPVVSMVSLTVASARTLTVRWATADGTASVADNDYVPASGTLNFAPGVTSLTITNYVSGDTVNEPNETFLVKLSTLFSFNGSSGNEAMFAPDGQPANANVSTISRGPGLDPVPATDAFSSRSWTTAFGPYYSFSITPNVGSPTMLTGLDFDARRTSTGPGNLAVRSSLDGFAADLATFSLQDPDTLVHFATTLGAAFQGLTAPVEFRIYGSGATDANGALLIDNVEPFGDFNQGIVAILNDDCIAPSITQQPLAATRCVGEPITFSVAATGVEPLSYQWRKDGGDIAGATNSSYAIASVTAADAGSYTVVVDNPCGSDISIPAVLTVSLPTTAIGPGDLVHCVGESAGFSTVASGTGPFTYQWSKDGVDIIGATADTISFSSVTASDSGIYCVVVSGTCNRVTNCASLMVNTPTAATGPTDLVLCPGQSASFSTVASGTGPHSYQWRKDGVDISGASAPTYSIASVSLADAGTYCVVVNGACNSITNCATLTVNLPITVNGPSDQVHCLGETVSFSAVASGTGPFTYQWSKDGADISGATNATYDIASVGMVDAGNYCVIVSGTCNSLTNCAVLTVNTPTTAAGPVDLVRCQGQSAAFSTTAAGTGPFAYQWSKDGVDILGATQATLSIASVTAADDGNYCVVVSGACGAVTNCAMLMVTVPTTASGPSDATVTLGLGAVLSTTASGTGPFSYQWSKDGVDIIGATGASLMIAPVAASDAGAYCVVVTGSCNSATNCALLAVCIPPGASGPADATVCQGADATFTTSASGDGPFSYEWSLDGSAVGTNGPVLTVPTGALPTGTHTVAVVVTGQCGSLTNRAALTVNPLTTASGPTNTTVCPGVDATFATTANGTGPFTYQWTLDGNSAGTNGATLTVNTTGLSLGDHIVAVTITGLCGSVTNSAILTVNETEPPVLVCPANVVTNTAPGQCTQVIGYTPVVSDNCPGVTVSCSPPSGSSFGTGTTPVTCTATDVAGNTSSCSFNVTVNDTESPVVVCPLDVVTNAAPGLCVQMVGYAPSASDNCAGVTVTCNPPSGSSFGTGATPVTCSATDAAGNTASCSFTVTVNDTEPPGVVCPANVVTNTAPGLCTQVVGYTPVTSDNCPGATVTCNPPSGSSFGTGTTSVTCTATDAAGNSNSCTFTVTVNETESPILACPANVATNTAPGLCAQVVGYTPVSSDNCPGVTVTCIPPSGSIFGTGATPVTCTATDAAGNTSSCSFTVTVNDTELPALVCPANLVSNTAPGLCTQVIGYAPAASDNCPGATVTCNPPSGSTFGTGTTPVTCTTTDAAGNSSSCSFTVTVNDTEPPGVVCPANVVTNTAPGLCTQVVDYAPVASDNCPGVTVSCNPATGSSFGTGTTPVTCTATDAAGNTSSCSFTVTVNETEPPVVVCPANVVTNTAPGQCKQVVSYAPVASDNCPGVTVSCNPPTGTSFATGTTPVTCTATDAAGNTSSCNFTVTVNDTESPVVVCPANVVTNTASGQCVQIVGYAPTASDNCPDVTVTCNPPSSSSFGAGTTQVACTATDAAGNTSSCSFAVTVNDAEPPMVVCPANVVTNAAPGLCTQVVDYAPTASDNCSGVTVSCSPPSGSSFGAGTTPVTCTATDAAGNNNSCTFTVSVNESEPPVLVCPANVVTNTAPGLCTQVVGYTPGSSDNCPGGTVTCNPPSGSSFGTGTTPVTCTATDAAGNSNSCTFTVTVNETEPPVLACPANVVTNTAPGLCAQVVGYTPASSDNCPGVTVICIPPSGSSFGTGATPVTCTATDAAGNSSSCSFTVTVNDTELPALVCPANLVSNTAPGLCTQVIGYAPAASDNCPGVTVFCNPPSGSTFGTGTTPVTCTATDAAGNSNSCTFTVSVNESEPPVLVCPANVVTNTAPGLCTQVVGYTPGSSDNCPGGTVTCNPPSGSSFGTGTTPVTCTATDAAGNSNSCTFTVTVNETEPPVLACPANVVTNTAPGLCAQVVGYTPAFNDNCPGVTVICIPPSGSSFGTGATPVTCTATDAAGNTSSCTFTVMVNDTEPPVAVCPPSVLTNTAAGQCVQTVGYAPTATDNCPGLTVTCIPPSGSSFGIGLTPVTCTAVDAAGNTASCSFSVTVNDVESPIVVCPANVVTNASAGQCTQVVGYTPVASDNCSGVTVSCNPPSGSSFGTGTTPVSCTATDAAGNSSTCSFTVTVNETEPPVLVCPANVVTNTAPGLCTQVVTYAPVASDNCPGTTVTCNPPSGSSFGTGTTPVSCTATDTAGNSSSCSFTVIVNETEPPVLACPANVVTNTAPGLCAHVVGYTPVSSDNCPGVTVTCIPPSGSSFGTGTTPVTCTATDAAGNTSSCSFTVTVNDMEPPIVGCPANVVTNAAPGLCTQVVGYTPATSDICSGVTVSCSPPSGSSFGTGTTPVNCTATDAAGNTSSCSFSVTVNDVEPPVIVCPADVVTNTAGGQCVQIVGYAPIASDNCPGVTVNCDPPSGSSFGTGTTLVICTATDAADNASSCFFTVTINETEPPVLACPANVVTNTAQGLCTQVVGYTPTATDNCPGVTVTCNPSAGSTFGTGTTPVTCTATDAAGNSSSCSFTVTVNDAEPTVVVCPANVVTNTAPGQSTQVVGYAPAVSDNCPGVTVSCNPPSGSSFGFGTTPVTCTATDAAGNTSGCTFTVTVTSGNRPPVAVDDTASTPEDTPVLVAPLVNDTDPDGDTLTIVSATAVNGAVTIMGGTNLYFTPATNFNGIAIINYTISDGNGGTDSATVIVTVTPVNDPPVAVDDAATTAQNVSLNLSTATLLANDTDVDGDPLTVTSASANSSQGGTVLLTGLNVVYNPPTNFVGTDSFTYTISDGQGGTSTARVVVTVIPAQFGIFAGPKVFNPQTGLFEQQVIVTNNGPATVAAVRLCVAGLRTGVQLYNAVGTDANRPYVQCNAPLNPGQSVSIRLEFYVPDRRPFTNTLEAKAVLPTAIAPSLTGGVLIDRSFVDWRIAGEPRYVIEFTTIPGRTYTIIYSDDMITWKPATPSITATANRTQWYDDGPPKTDSKPTSNNSRYYRVILAPANP